MNPGRRRLLAAAPAVALAACAPLVQRSGRPGLGFPGPRIETGAFESFDGARIPLMSWPTDGEPWAVIVGAHGMNDYANAFHLAGPAWAARGIATYAYDQRGFGRAPRRGIWGGEPLMTEDLRTLTALARARHPKAVIAVVGESMGGAVAIEAFASDRPPAANRLVLLAPAVWGWSSQPFVNRAALWISAHTFRGSVVEPPRFVTNHIQASDNLQELYAMGRDPLMLWGARPDAIWGLVRLMQHAWRDTGRLRAPVLYAYGAHDQIIPRKPTLQAVARLKPEARTAWYDQGWHLLMRDLGRAAIIDDVAAFIRDPAVPLPSGAPPIRV